MFALKYFVKNCLFKCFCVHHLWNGVSRNHGFTRNKAFKFPAQGADFKNNQTTIQWNNFIWTNFRYFLKSENTSVLDSFRRIFFKPHLNSLTFQTKICNHRVSFYFFWPKRGLKNFYSYKKLDKQIIFKDSEKVKIFEICLSKVSVPPYIYIHL